MILRDTIDAIPPLLLKESTIAISSSLLAALPVKNADALGILPRGDPNLGGPGCFGRGTLILTAHGEVPVENLANGALVMTTNGALPVNG